MTEAPIRAAGAVLWRRRPDGAVEVAVIHRPRYDDWSLPKGKLDPGETAAAAALREVHEETGQAARPGASLGEVRYLRHRRARKPGRDAPQPPRSREKVVEYWAMEALGGEHVPGDEVDAVRWLPPGPATELLTYDHDRALLARAVAGGTLG